MKHHTYTLKIVVEQSGFREDDIIKFIDFDIITPFDRDNLVFDEEDLQRILLIKHLRDNCSTNNESLQVILHLVDQIHYLKRSS